MKHIFQGHRVYQGFFDLGKLCKSTSSDNINSNELTEMKNDMRGYCWLGLDIRSTNVLWGLDLMDIVLLGIQHIRKNFSSIDDEKIYNSLCSFYENMDTSNFESGYMDHTKRTLNGTRVSYDSTIKTSLATNTLRLLNLMNLGCMKIHNMQIRMASKIQTTQTTGSLSDLLLDLSVYHGSGTCTYIISAPLLGAFSFVFNLRICR